jgi:hypothetical protein
MNTHIPTLTLNLYSESNLYTYEYDDIHGNTQEEGMFASIGEALSAAAKTLKTFTFIGIENK